VGRSSGKNESSSWGVRNHYQGHSGPVLLGVGSIRIAQASAGENELGGIEPQPSDAAEVKIIRSGVLRQL
jgi:hypothetical protein